jgi:hypothetical protein
LYNLSEVISAKRFFLWSLSEWLSAQACIFFKNTQKMIIQIKNENKGKNKTKGNIYIIYKGKNQAKYLFRAWPFTG